MLFRSRNSKPDQKRKPVDRTSPVTRDYTINLHKRTHKVTFKRKAPRAIKEIKKFAQKAMGTNDVRIESALNQYVWSKGIKGVPHRIRVRLARKQNEDEEAKEKVYTLATLLLVTKRNDFRGVGTAKVASE